MKFLANPLIRLGIAAVACTMRVVAAPLVSDRPLDKAFPGKAIEFPVQEQTWTFEGGELKNGFTGLQGMKEAQTDTSGLHFRLDGVKAVLGWGYFKRNTSDTHVLDHMVQDYSVVLRVRQEKDLPSLWTLAMWQDGARMGIPNSTARLQGTAWQALTFSFKTSKQFSPPDAFELTIEGSDSAGIVIESVTFVQPVKQGYLRFEFDLPDGKVWRALSDMLGTSFPIVQAERRLFINGNEITWNGPLYPTHTGGVDIKPYLTPGRNCIGLYGKQSGRGDFPMYLHANIVMESGEQVRVHTDASWQSAAKAGDGWSETGYDAGDWAAANERRQIPYLWFRCWMERTICLPAYKGRLLLRQPGQQSLAYVQGEPVKVDVLAPAGLEPKRPVLEFEWGKADRTGATPVPVRGEAAVFRQEGDSLVFSLDLGELDHGIYTLACRLKTGETLLEQREREPLRVQRRLTGQSIKGTAFREGLNLQMEDRIDFTNPADQHPWVETTPSTERTEPVIVRTNGMVYRETAGQRGASFRYRFEFQEPGTWYLLELDYPDDAERVVEASVTTKLPGHSNSQSGVGAETGGRLMTTDSMQTLRWLHIADPGVHSIDIVNGRTGTRAAASSLSMYRVKGDLPWVRTGRNRRFGIHTERCSYGSGIGKNFGVARPPDGRHEPPIKKFIRDQVFLEAAADRYVQYLRFAGQNTHIMGCFQYNDRNSPFLPVREWDSSRLPQCVRSVMADMFELNDIDFFAGMEITQFQRISTRVNNRAVGRGADTVWMIGPDGRQKAGRDVVHVQNWLHPRYRAALSRTLHQLNDKFVGYRRYRGIHVLHGPAQTAGYYPPALADARAGYDKPYLYSYDDETFSRFEAASGVSLKLDLQHIGDLAGVWLGRWTVGWRLAGQRQNPLMWVPIRDPRIITAFNATQRRYVFVRTSWDENVTLGPGVTFRKNLRPEIIRSDWVLNQNKVRVLPQHRGALSRRALAYGLITADPGALMHGFTDLNINVGREQEQREFALVYTRLPRERFSPVLNTGLGSNLAIRRLSNTDGTWLYVVNPGFWKVKAQVLLTAGGHAVDVGSGRTLTLDTQDTGRTWNIELGPYGLAACRVDDPDVKVVSYAVQPLSRAAVDHMTSVIRRVDSMLENPVAGRAASDETLAYLGGVCAQARQALGRKDYALAWSALRGVEFVDAVEDKLERLRFAATLPDSVAVQAGHKSIDDLPRLVAKPVKGVVRIDGRLDEQAWQARPFQAGYFQKDG